MNINIHTSSYISYALISIASLVISPSQAQNKPLRMKNIDQFLISVENNNNTLKALNKEMEAARSNAFTDIVLSDPSIGVNYLWGSPSNLESNRLDLSLTQELEFPTVYHYRRKIAQGLATEAEINYLIRRREILLDAASSFIELAFNKEKGAVLNELLNTTQADLEATNRLYLSGSASIITLNKARFDLIEITKEVEANAIESSRLEAILHIACGDNHDFDVIPDNLPDDTTLPIDFDSWYSNVETICPEIILCKHLADNGQNNIKLQKSQWLPKFSVGYMSERTSETTLQGIGLGISIPLFENKNKVHSAQAQYAAAEANLTDIKLRKRAEVQAILNQCRTLFQSANTMQQTLLQSNIQQTLLKAYESGELNIMHYHAELKEYYNMKINAIEIKKQATLLAEQLRILER